MENILTLNNQQLNQFNNKALDKYTEMGYVTKAVNLQKEQQKITDKLYDDNRQKQNEITKLNQEILNLQLTAEQKAPTLAHLKYYAKLFNVDNDTAIIIFIVMIMTVFDTLAMYLMITSDWISKLDDEIKIINNNQINYDTNELNKIETKLNQLLDMKPIEKINNNQDIDFSPVFNAIKQDSDYQIDSLKKVVNENSKITINKLNEEFIKLQNNLKDNTLIDKLTTIEENLKEVQNKSNKIEVNNIDEQLDNLINSINDNDSIIGTNSFKKYILDNPLVLDYLRDYFKNDKKVLTKLNKL